MAKQTHFKSKSGKSIDDIRELFGADYTLKRSRENKKKYVLTVNETGEEKYFRFRGKIEEFYQAVKDLGTDDFLSEYGIDEIVPKGQKRAVARKVKKVSKKAQRKAKQEAKTRYEELDEEKTKIVLEIMNMDLTRNSPEHLALREKLRKVREEMDTLDYDGNGKDKLIGLTAEDLSEIKARGEAKKRKKAAEKKARKESINTRKTSNGKKD